MDNRGLCVGKAVTSGRTEAASMAHKEAETKSSKGTGECGGGVLMRGEELVLMNVKKSSRLIFALSDRGQKVSKYSC